MTSVRQINNKREELTSARAHEEENNPQGEPARGKGDKGRIKGTKPRQHDHFEDQGNVVRGWGERESLE